MGSQIGIGERLRSERIRRKRSIEEISRETRIAPRMLEAIEKEEFNSLPGLLFTRNFVKQYALALALDPEPILAQLPQVDISTAPLPEPPVRSKHTEIWDPEWNGAISSFVWFAIAIAAGVAAYMHFNRPMETAAGSRVPQAVTETAQPGSGSGSPPRTDVARAEIADAAPVPTSDAASNDPNNAPAGQPNGAKPLETDAEVATSHRVNVSITAHADSWIQVTADGKPVFTGILKPNESRQISGDEVVKLVAGNAGGITVSLNGRTLDRLGAEGQVKVIRLTGEGLQAGVVNPRPMDDRL